MKEIWNYELLVEKYDRYTAFRRDIKRLEQRSGFKKPFEKNKRNYVNQKSGGHQRVKPKKNKKGRVSEESSHFEKWISINREIIGVFNVEW